MSLLSGKITKALLDMSYIYAFDCINNHYEQFDVGGESIRLKYNLNKYDIYIEEDQKSNVSICKKGRSFNKEILRLKTLNLRNLTLDQIEKKIDRILMLQ